jgi:hypothetical protein
MDEPNPEIPIYEPKLNLSPVLQKELVAAEVTVEPKDEAPVPEPNLQQLGLDPDDLEDAQYCVKDMNAFINGHIITDDFTGHDARQAWSIQMTNKSRVYRLL